MGRDFLSDVILGGPIARRVKSAAIGTFASMISGAGELFGGGDDGPLAEAGGDIQAVAELVAPKQDLGIVGTGLDAIGSTVPLVGVGFINPWAALGASGLVSADEGARRARAKGVSEGGVRLAALSAGVAGAAFERIGAPFRIAKTLSGQATKTGLRQSLQFMEGLIDNAAGEGLEEALQGFSQDFIERTYNPEQDLFSVDAGIRRAKEFGLGAFVGGALGGAAKAIGDLPPSVSPAPHPKPAVEQPDAVVREVITEQNPRPAPDPDAPRFQGVADRMKHGLDKEAAVEQVAQELADHITAAADVEAEVTEDLEIPQVFEKTPFWAKAALYGERPRRLFERLDGLVPDGPMKQFFYDRITDKWFSFNRRNKARQDRFRQAVGEITGDSADGVARIFDRVTRHGIEGGQLLEVNGGERIGFWMLMKESQARDEGSVPRKLLDGYRRSDGSEIERLSAEQITDILGEVSAEERAMADFFAGEFEAEFEDLSEAFKEVTGEQLGHVESIFPNIGDRITENVDMSNSEHILSAFTGRAPAAKVQATEKKQFTQQRQEEARQRLEVDAFMVFDAHGKQVDFYTEVAPTLTELRAVASTEQFQRALKGAYGTSGTVLGKRVQRFGDANTYVKGWLEDVGRAGPLQAQGGISSIMRWLRVNQAAAVLGFKAGVIAKQAISSITAGAEYGNMSAIMHGWGQVIAGVREGGLDLDKNPAIVKMKKLIPELEFRNQERELDELVKALRNSGKQRKLTQLQRKAIRWGIGGILFADKATVAASVLGIYENELARGVSEEQAIEAARRNVQLTQPQSAVKDLPPVFREPDEMAKLFTVFTNQVNQNWNQDLAFGRQVARDVKRKKLGLKPSADAKTASEISQFVLWRYLTIPMILAMIDLAGEPEEKDVASAFVRNITSGIPMIGSLVSAMTFGAEINSSPDFIGGITAAGPGRAAVGLFQAGRGDFRRGARNLITGAGSTVGLPTDILRVLDEGVEAVQKGEAKASDPRTFLFSRFQRRRLTEKKDEKKGEKKGATSKQLEALGLAAPKRGRSAEGRLKALGLR